MSAWEFLFWLVGYMDACPKDDDTPAMKAIRAKLAWVVQQQEREDAELEDDPDEDEDEDWKNARKRKR